MLRGLINVVYTWAHMFCGQQYRFFCRNSRDFVALLVVFLTEDVSLG